LFDVIHSLDRESLAAELAKLNANIPRMPKLLVQVNTGAEDQKSGVLPEDADAFIARCRDVHGLTIAGLMCIPPFTENPAPHFALLEKIARRNGLKELSMGMSADFESAIKFGATYVRVGSAIFGER
jgi:pyridoxal phosphate enzyme (YggS family)